MHERIVTWGARKLAPVWKLAVRVVRNFDTPVVETTGDDLEPTSRVDWKDLEPELLSGVVRSVNVAWPGQGLLTISAPRFAGSSRAEWEAVLDCSEAVAAQTYRDAKDEIQLSYVALSVDDCPSVDGPVVTVASFPWLHWSLLLAAVRSAGGEWTERRGSRWNDRAVPDQDPPDP